ncbi:MAG: glycosyltransferase family 4 protein [Candidatus Rokuibacteriota bacterium]
MWIGRAEGFVAIEGLIDAPHVVDLDDLKDRRIEGSLRVGADGSRSPAERARSRRPSSRLRSLGTRHRDSVNVRRWRALEHRVASSAHAVVVCSALDQRRLGVRNAVVIPNGYPAPPSPAGRVGVGQPPTLVMPGLLRYGPNIDAAHFFVKQVLPRIRAHKPEVRVRLVGDHDERVSELAAADGVTLTGLVPDIIPELELADAVVVPVRFGSGTRVKILEAWAHRIPVVSTVVGCEGLDAVHRRHLLMGDDADEFASACIEILTDQALRTRLTDEGHALYWQRYRWEVVASGVAELALGVARGRGTPSPVRSG